MKKAITNTTKGKMISNYSNDVRRFMLGILLISHGLLWWRGMWYESSFNERVGLLIGERISSMNLWFSSMLILFVVIVGALIDLAIAKDKENAITCYIILGIEEGIILSILSFLASIWAAGACCLVCTAVLAILLVVRIRKIKPVPEDTLNKPDDAQPKLEI